MSVTLAPPMFLQFLAPNNSGSGAVGFKLFTYQGGTSTKQNTWTDSTQTVLNSNPILLDGNGVASIWGDPTLSYKFVWAPANDTDPPSSPLRTLDNFYFPLNMGVIANITSVPLLPSLIRSAAEISLGITPTNYSYPVGHVLRYGAVGDGSTNNYTAFKNAIAVAQATGNVVTVPAGNFKIDTASGTLTCSYVTIQGTGVTDGSSSPANAGSVLSIVSTTNSPFTIGPGVSFVGLAFFYPAQVDSASPIVFPPTIITSLSVAGAINFVFIESCTVFNAYRFFVDTDSTGGIGHVYIQNNTIYGILTCFELAYNAEILEITDNEFTFGHYLAATESGLRSYTRANGTVCKITRTDGIMFQRNVLFGYQNGLYFNTSGNLCQQTAVLGNYFDQCLFAILCDGTGNVTQLTISGNFFNALNNNDHTQVGNCIKIATSGSVASEVITISGVNSFALCTGDVITTSGNTPVRALAIIGNNATVWGAFQASSTYAFMNINGNATSFTATGNQIIAGAGAGATLKGIIGSYSDCCITGNMFGNCAEALNISSNKAVVVGNQSFSTSGTHSNNYTFVAATFDLANFWDKDSLQTTGWGTPVGGAVIASYNITDAGGASSNTNKALAEIIAILKAKGIIGA